MASDNLFSRVGPDYTTRQVVKIMGRRDPQYLWQLRRSGDGPPFRRLGRRHSRVTYPRAQFWVWWDSFVYKSEAEADEAQS